MWSASSARAAPRRPLVDPQRPRRRGAGRTARPLDARSVRRRDRRRLDVRARRRRHEVGHHGLRCGGQGAAPRRRALARRPLRRVGDRGGGHRQRHAGVRPARLPRRLRAHHRAHLDHLRRSAGRAAVVRGDGRRQPAPPVARAHRARQRDRQGAGAGAGAARDSRTAGTPRSRSIRCSTASSARS